MSLKGGYIVILMVALCGCQFYKKVPAESDYSYRANFHKYSSYNFFIDKTPASGANDFVPNKVIEEVIGSRLQSQGFRRDHNNPELVILYKMYNDDLNLIGYSQPDLGFWLKHESQEHNYKVRKHNLHRGTLLIVFFDKIEGRVVWQGYVSKQSGSTSLYDEKAVKTAVRTILDQFQVIAFSQKQSML